MKSANWISQIGRIPYKAAPIPTPTIDSSANGESITRPAPYFSNNPWVALNTPPRGPTSSPTINTRSSRANSSSIACRRPSMRVISGMGDVLGVDRIGAFGYLRVGCTFGELDRLIDLLPCPRIHLHHRLRCQEPLVQELRGEAIQRITRSPLRDFLPRTVASVIVVG